MDDALATLLRGETVFLLGGGSSLRGFAIDRLRGRQVMAINSSYRLCSWSQSLYFSDIDWFHNHRTVVENWVGLAATATQSGYGLPEKVLRLIALDRDDFGRGDICVKHGPSSGHVAISLAIAMGAARVILLGYDMGIIGGRSHHHDDYQTESDKLFRDDFLPGFAGWNAAAERAGVEVLNCTPGSALTEFPMASIDMILGDH